MKLKTALLATALAMTPIAAMAAGENVVIDLTNINLPGTVFSVSGSVTEAAGGLDVSLVTDGFNAPDLFFHGSSGHPSFGFDLGGLVAGLAIVNANIGVSAASFFDPTNNVTTPAIFSVVTQGGGQAYDGFGKFTFNLECGGACQAGSTDVTTLNFHISDSAGTLLLANLVNNGNGNLFGLDVWTDTGGTVATGFAAVGIAAAVPEPSTWAMMLLGFVGLAAAFRQRRRIAGFA